MSQDLWVYIETEHQAAKQVGLELLQPAKKLALQTGGTLCAVIISDAAEQAVQQAAAHGAEKIYLLEAPEYANYSTDAFTTAFCQLAEKYQPAAILIGATTAGCDFAPRLSGRLKTGMTSDCTMLDVDEEGNIAWTLPTFGGNLMATVVCAEHRPQIGTVRPGVFEPAAADPTHVAEIIREDIRVPEQSIRTRLLQIIEQADTDEVDLENAEIVVAGGRGVGSAANFDYIYQLAETLGATVGTTRAAIDAGWITHAHQIGQTGKNIKAKLYIAAGISGAIQHTVGIGGAEIVVAINNDPKADIFKFADIGIVGDLTKVLPALNEEIKRIKQARS